LESEILTIKNDIKIVKTILNDNVRDASALCKEIETMEERKLKNFLNKASNKCEKEQADPYKKTFFKPRDKITTSSNSLDISTISSKSNNSTTSKNSKQSSKSNKKPILKKKQTDKQMNNRNFNMNLKSNSSNQGPSNYLHENQKQYFQNSRFHQNHRAFDDRNSGKNQQHSIPNNFHKSRQFYNRQHSNQQSIYQHNHFKSTSKSPNRVRFENRSYFNDNEVVYQNRENGNFQKVQQHGHKS
jgi:hypothetical protein